MIIHFRHPAMADGFHERSGKLRKMVGWLTTPVDVHDLSSRDVEVAFDVENENPDLDTRIVRYEGHFYKPVHKSYERVFKGCFDFNGLADFTEQTRAPFWPFHSGIAEEIRASARDTDMPKLFPAPRSPKLADPELVKYETVMQYLESVQDMPSHADPMQIEYWRNEIRRFVSNFILVDGIAHRRTGVPIYGATFTSVGPSSTDIYSRYQDRLQPWSLGGNCPGPDVAAAYGLMFDPRDLNAARRLSHEIKGVYLAKGISDGRRYADVTDAFIASLNRTRSARITPYIDFELADLETRDFVRFAKIHMLEGKNQITLYQKDRRKTDDDLATGNVSREISDLQASMRAMKDALDRYDFHGEDIEIIELAFEPLRKNVQANRFATSNTQYLSKVLDLQTKFMLDRYEARPLKIDAGMLPITGLANHSR